MWLLFNLYKTQSYQQVIIANQRYGLRDGAVLTRALKLINEIESKKKKNEHEEAREKSARQSVGKQRSPQNYLYA